MTNKPQQSCKILAAIIEWNTTERLDLGQTKLDLEVLKRQMEADQAH